jgi:hypothetical protein
MRVSKSATERNVAVRLIADLLKEIPTSSPYQAALLEMQQENSRLKAENAELKEELAQFINNWETLDWDAVRALIYLSEHEHGHAQEIAGACPMHIQIAESSLSYLAKGGFVHAPLNGEPRYGLAHKGRRYLRERGLQR